MGRASRGDWRARRFLQRKASGPSAFVTQSLVHNFGSRAAAVDHVREHLAQRFAASVGSPVFFSGLPVSEPDFTEQEVSAAVAKLKTGKTTGMSHVSVELLRCLVSLSFPYSHVEFLSQGPSRCPCQACFWLGHIVAQDTLAAGC